MITKQEVANQLTEAARLLAVLSEDRFRARAYRAAARQLGTFEGDLVELAAAGRLTDIRGVGSGLAGEIRAALERGELAVLEDLRARVPEGVRDLFRVSGLGARKVAQLWAAGIGDLKALVCAAAEGQVAALKGFGAKSAENILAGARFALQAKQRMRLDEADTLAAHALRVLRAALSDATVTVAGELRRGLETIGGLDLIVTDAAPAALTRAVTSLLAGVDEATSSGTLAGYPVKITAVGEDGYSAALAVATGGDFAGVLIDAAEDRGLELNRQGLFGPVGMIPVRSEAALFERLGLPYLPPELREARDAVPVEGLLEPVGVRGLVHNHSTWSDAAHSIREMTVAARDRGFAYLALADHSRSSFYANGLSIEQVVAQAEEIEQIRGELRRQGSDFELLHGIEVDILADGDLDYPDEVLAGLDYTVVSVHQNFYLPEAEQTARIVRAVSHPHASILGHASGRLLLRRPPYPVDLDAVIAACAEHGTVIEINANPYRLDLDWRWVAKAKALGCRFSVNPDAHRVEGYDDLRYGITMARKAGLTTEDVVNTAPTGRAFLAQLERPLIENRSTRAFRHRQDRDDPHRH